ncbi:hypothetical protein D9619_011442 [Psilocybe cf. subviscida]|uniref:Uncharacterized protein n=1 Tax=Psilocybe cf. subviscida TaxID=2480587 RepID=A0A8H5FA24_9AGAR|nr:hypothetical protein D9619_011442 [Psilocybe cf. subviscida]
MVSLAEGLVTYSIPMLTLVCLFADNETVLEIVSLGAGLGKPAQTLLLRICLPSSPFEAVPVKVLKLQYFSSFRTVTNIVIPEDMSLSLALAVDILIAGSLSIYLHNRRSGLPR